MLLLPFTAGSETVKIGTINYWFNDDDSALEPVRRVHKPSWLHSARIRAEPDASISPADSRVVKASLAFVPVLRVHDLAGHDIGGRLDGNLCAGDLPLEQVLQQLQTRLGR